MVKEISLNLLLIQGQKSTRELLFPNFLLSKWQSIEFKKKKGGRSGVQDESPPLLLPGQKLQLEEQRINAVFNTLQQYQELVQTLSLKLLDLPMIYLFHTWFIRTPLRDQEK